MTNISVSSFAPGFLALCLVLLFSCTADKTTSPASKAPDWTLSRVDGSKLLFENGTSLETGLYELAYIGQVPGAAGESPMLIFSGKYCTECDANVSIYTHTPGGSTFTAAEGRNREKYPGTENHYETGITLYTARAFYGEVLDNTNGVIWYQTVAQEDGKTAGFIRLKNSAVDTVYADNGTLEQTLKLFEAGKCAEISGKTYTSEP